MLVLSEHVAVADEKGRIHARAGADDEPRGAVALPPKRARAYGASRLSLLVASSRVSAASSVSGSQYRFGWWEERVGRRRGDHVVCDGFGEEAPDIGVTALEHNAWLM
jgi:hypothetical protein